MGQTNEQTVFNSRQGRINLMYSNSNISDHSPPYISTVELISSILTAIYLTTHRNIFPQLIYQLSRLALLRWNHFKNIRSYRAVNTFYLCYKSHIIHQLDMLFHLNYNIFKYPSSYRAVNTFYLGYECINSIN